MEKELKEISNQLLRLNKNLEGLILSFTRTNNMQFLKEARDKDQSFNYDAGINPDLQFGKTQSDK